MKMTAIVSYFDEFVSKGSDESCKQRFDSLFLHLDQIQILIEDASGELYDKAHYCLDFVTSFLIFHLGMLCLAEEDFGLRDYG